MEVGELLPRLSILTLAGGLFLLHFPGSRLRLTLSAILPCEARTFLTIIPFGTISRNRPTRSHWNYNRYWGICQDGIVQVNKLEVYGRIACACVIDVQLLHIVIAHKKTPLENWGVIEYLRGRGDGQR